MSMTTIKSKTLVLGGIRSGKSYFAEQLAQTSGLQVTYVATAQVRLNPDVKIDTRWLDRIESHKARRPTHWQCIEEPLRLAAVLEQAKFNSQCLLIDCLSLWMTNLLLHDDSQLLLNEKTALLNALQQYDGQVVMVSSESNLGIVASDDLTRRYCDEIGILHQELATRCDRVVIVIAGLPQYLKGERF